MFKRYSTAFLLLAVVLLAIAFCGCTPDIIKAEPTVTALSVDGVVTTGYIAGDALDITHATLFVTYDNGEIKEMSLTEDMLDKTSFDMTVPGTHTVFVRYGGCSTSFQVEVQSWDLETVTLHSEPYVTDYVVGESIDLKGAVIRMFFRQSQNSAEIRYTDIPVTQDMLEDYDKETIGTQTIYLNYSDTRLHFDVNYSDKTATSVKIVDPAVNNYVFVGLGQYRFYLRTEDGARLNRNGEEVEEAQTYYYAEYVDAYAAKNLFETENKTTYVIGYANRYDFNGMSLRIGFDNEQTPQYDAMTGEAIEKDTSGNKIYGDIEDLSDCILVSIDDSVEKTVEAVLMYLPKDYPEEFRYSFYGSSYVSVGSYVRPDMDISSNSMIRDNEKITLDPIKSKSYGMVKQISTDASGRTTIVVSTSISYNLTSIAVKEGDLVAHNAPLGMYGRNAIFSVGGGIVTSVRDGVVTIRTAPTTGFTSKVQTKAFKSMTLINQDKILPLLHPDITTIDNMIQGDTIDLASGVVNITNADGTVEQRGPVRVDYTDGSHEYFKLNSSMISVVNAGVETVNDGLNLSRSGRYELWVVFGGEISYRTSFYVTIDRKYPVGLFIVTSTNTISGSRFYFGETISVASMRYYIRYNNEEISEERQVTEDMLGEGYSLYCNPESGAYDKKIRFKLRNEDLSLIPEDVNKEIFSEEFVCKVLPQSILNSNIAVLAKAQKVYVTSDDQIDLTGASYAVYYRNNVAKVLEGKEIKDAEGGMLSIGGTAVVQTDIGGDGDRRDVYLDNNTYRVYVDENGSYAAEPTRYTRLGVRKKARLIYRDQYYNDYLSDLGKEGGPSYYNESDLYSASIDFDYYVIENSSWTISGMKVNLSMSGGLKGYKDEYAQYEDWDLGGITVTLTITDSATGALSTSTIPATSDMIYDSTTRRIANDVPVKFYFLGVSDDNTLRINVGKRKEASLEMIEAGKNTYLSSSTGGMDFSDYEFYLHYNAGPYDVIRNLTGVSYVQKKDGWWYEIYQKNYVVYNETGAVVDAFGEISDAETSFYLTRESAEEAMAALQALPSAHTYSVGEVRGVLLNNLYSYIGEVYVGLHHSVSETASTEETDVCVYIPVTIVDSDDVMGVRYIGSEDEFIDAAGKVAGKYYAGYGSGREYTILNRYGLSIVLDHQGKEIGTVSATGVITPKNGTRIYYTTYEQANTYLSRLLSYSVVRNNVLNKYYVANGNGVGVDTTGAVGTIEYYATELGANESMRWIKRYSVPYFVAVDPATGRYVIKNAVGYITTSDGSVIRIYHSDENAAYTYADRLNGITAVDSTSASTYYYVTRMSEDEEVLYLNNDGEFENILQERRLFASIVEAREYLIEKGLSLYHVSNKLYVIAEIAAGWDIMMNEYINNNLVQKTLTVYYADGTVGQVPITAEMVSYNKMDSSTGYRKVTISYKNCSCEAYIYVWRAELTGVEISKEPLTNYIRESELDVSGGVLKLTFTKYNQKNQEAGYMYKYISMEDPDITYSGFSSQVFSKSGVKVTVNVLYKDYYTLNTSFVVTVYDLQDVTFTFNNTIFFYGNVSGAGYSTVKLIPEFTLPESGRDITMYYVEKKNLIPYKQFWAMNLTEASRDLYLPIYVNDERGELSLLYYLYTGDKVTSGIYDPAAGSYYVVYSAYVKKNEKGEVTERYTLLEYNNLSASEKALCVPVDGQGDVLYRYTAEEYAALTSSALRALCREESNAYYLLMTVKGNRYYETRNYCLKEYAIIPKVIDVKVVPSNPFAYVLRVTTKDNPAAILSLLNPVNLLPLTSKMKTDYPSIINTVSVMSPNSDYFELLIELPDSTEMEEVPVINAVKDCFYRLLYALVYDYDIKDIRLGSPEYIATNLDSSFSGSNERKVYSGGEYNTQYDYYMYDYIGHTMRGGVNVFTSLQSDTEYNITYEVTYGETLTRNGVLQLLSNRILLKNNGDGTFTTVQGSLGHSSYTVDLSPITISVTGSKKPINVTLLDHSEKDYVVRLYMKNASEVYSRWFVGGEFNMIRKELLDDPNNAFLSDLTVISPNNSYFELLFVIKDSVWVGTDEQKACLREVARSLIVNMIDFGAADVRLGGDVHLFGATDDFNAVALFTDGSAFERTVSFTSRAANVSIVDFYALYETILSTVDSSSPLYVADFSSVKSGITILNGGNRYVLRLSVFDTWMGADAQKNVLANACYDFMRDLLSAGRVYCNGEEVTTETPMSFYRDIIERTGVNDELVFELPFTFEGTLYTYVYDGLYSASKSAVLSSYGSVLSDVDIRTAMALSDLTFVWNGPSGDPTKIGLAFYALLDLVRQNADLIYYGSDMSIITSSTSSDDLLAQLTTAMKKGVNVFTYNSKKLYDISYNANASDMLHYNNVYVLFDGEPAVNYGGSSTETGQFGATEGAMANHILYIVDVTMGDADANRVLINP